MNRFKVGERVYYNPDCVDIVLVSDPDDEGDLVIVTTYVNEGDGTERSYQIVAEAVLLQYRKPKQRIKL
jgi:hypothetical protein